MKEIDIEIETKEVKAEIRKLPMSVRSVFYKGFFGKARTICIWIRRNRHQTFKSYLDSSVTYGREPAIDIQYGLNIEGKITNELIKELKKEISSKE